MSCIIIDSSASLQKFREYLEGSNLITKLQAKHDLLQRTLGEGKYHTINWEVFPRLYNESTEMPKIHRKKIQNLKLNCWVNIDVIFICHSLGAVVSVHTVNCFYFFNTYCFPLHRCLDKLLYLATELLNEKSYVWKESNTVSTVWFKSCGKCTASTSYQFLLTWGFFKTWGRVIFLKHTELSRMHPIQWTH